MDSFHVGHGDERLEDDSHEEAEPVLPPMPEASFRHAHHSEAEIPEIRSTQLIPGALDEHEEPGMEPQLLKFNQPTRHDSK